MKIIKTKIALLSLLLIALVVPQQSQAVNWKKWTQIGIQTAVIVAGLYLIFANNDSDTESYESEYSYDQNDIITTNNNQQNSINDFKEDDDTMIIEKLEISSENNVEDKENNDIIEIKLNEYNQDKKQPRKNFLSYDQTFKACEYAEEIKRCIESQNKYDNLRVESLFEIITDKKLLKDVLKHNYSKDQNEELRLIDIAEPTLSKDVVEKYYQLHVQNSLEKKNKN